MLYSDAVSLSQLCLNWYVRPFEAAYNVSTAEFYTAVPYESVYYMHMHVQQI